MRKQFETRVRLVIYMDQLDLNRLTARAKREGRVLVAWARDVLIDAITEHSIDPLAPRTDETTEQWTARTKPLLKRKRIAKNPPLADGDPTKTETYYHTATSSRFRCLCESCVAYRHDHGIPLGGMPKRAKK
jgi:hypothetical protein